MCMSPLIICDQEVELRIASQEKKTDTSPDKKTYTRSDVDDFISNKMRGNSRFIDDEYLDKDIISYQNAAWNAVTAAGEEVPGSLLPRRVVQGSLLDWLTLKEAKCSISEKDYRVAIINAVAIQVQKQAISRFDFGVDWGCIVRGYSHCVECEDGFKYCIKSLPIFRPGSNFTIFLWGEIFPRISVAMSTLRPRSLSFPRLPAVVGIPKKLPAKSRDELAMLIFEIKNRFLDNEENFFEPKEINHFVNFSGQKLTDQIEEIASTVRLKRLLLQYDLK